MTDDPKPIEFGADGQKPPQFNVPKLIEIVLFAGIAVQFLYTGVSDLITFKLVDSLLFIVIGLTATFMCASVLGLLSISAVDLRRARYSAGGFMGPVLCHHLFYNLILLRWLSGLKDNLPFLYEFDGVYGYIIALVVGAALACEMELRHRVKAPVMLPMTFLIGLVMGAGTMLVVYGLGLMAVFYGAPGLVGASILAVVVFYALRLSGPNYGAPATAPLLARAPVAAAVAPRRSREEDLEQFRILMNQLNHEDYLLLSRAAFAVFGQPLSIILYAYCKKNNIEIIPGLIVWSNLVASIIIYISILGAFRVYVETRVKIRPLVRANPDFPIRRLPDIHPGLGLYCPVMLGLVAVLVWSSLLYVEAGTDKFHQIAAIVITSALAAAGVIFGIYVGSGLSEEAGPESPGGREPPAPVNAPQETATV